MKKWEKPLLVVMGRGTPEENVLTFCKGTTGASPNSQESDCERTQISGGYCPDCDLWTAS
jgi:hypothetical protein